MKKIIKRQNRLSREVLTNPFPNKTLKERLIRSKAIDYKENCTIENLKNGYMQISPKDKNKLVKY
ncbi:hypothetical protein [Clostridium tyrobutyricum]|uniref:hypothetical protein n=1 Tax=Clostridium tyrobutyricum TaxID=1519 RepID=UPI00189ED54B|nr:hypothetical protein [Clostridium tyrobutyricum]